MSMELTINGLGTFHLKTENHTDEAKLSYEQVHICGEKLSLQNFCPKCNRAVMDKKTEVLKRYNDQITLTQEYADKIKDACVRQRAVGKVVAMAEITGNESLWERLREGRRLAVSKGAKKAEKDRRTNDYAMLCAGLKAANACVVANLSTAPKSYAREIVIFPDVTGSYLVEMPLWYSCEIKPQPYPEVVVNQAVREMAGKKIATLITAGIWEEINAIVPDALTEENKLLEAYKDGTLEAQINLLNAKEVSTETSCDWAVATA